MPAPTREISPESVPGLRPRHMFRWEESQNSWLLLYPEGVVKLNAVAGEIMRRCDGVRNVDSIMAELVTVFDAPVDTVREGARSFLETALEKGWLEIRS